jgi:sulfatase modifying factor 1
VAAAATFLLLTQARPDQPANAPADAADPVRGKEPGQVRDGNGLTMKLVWCPPGVVRMETVEVITEPAAAKKQEKQNDDDVDPPAEPVREPRQTEKITTVNVFLSQGYWLGKYEVTQAEWKQVMRTEPWKGQEHVIEGDEIPATYVNWEDATEFCRKLTEEERKAGRLPDGWEYRLPTEAQWERACRARSATAFSFGDDAEQVGDYAWWGAFDNGNARNEQYAHKVGLKKSNPWGLHDMHGNVWEWCRDWYTGELPGGRDPEVREGGPDRVLRSGGWNDPPRICRSASRLRYDPSSRRKNVGLRVALSAIPQKEPAKPAKTGQ